MPRVEEYLPETEGQGPVGAISPNLDQVSAPGRALQTAGSELSQSANQVYNRMQQMEQSDAYENIAAKRAEFLDNINDQVNKGTLDVGQVKDQYQQWVDQQSDNYQTAGGKNYFNRQAARLGGQITQKAMRGQVQVGAENFTSSFQNGMNANSNVIENNPDMIQDVYHGDLETIHDAVQSGTIPQKMADKFAQTIGAEYSQAAVKGYAKSDPQKARDFLDSGQTDMFLNANQKDQMYAYVDSAEKANDLADDRASALAAKADEAKINQQLNALVEKNAKGPIDPMDILKVQMNPNDPRAFEIKNRLFNMVEQMNQREQKTSPSIYNDIESRMYLPDNDPRKISDISQIIGTPGVAPQDIHKLSVTLSQTPQGEYLTEQKKNLMNMAKSSLTKTNPMIGESDPAGEYKLMMFSKGLADAENDLRAQKKPLGDLYNPNSPSFYGKNIQQYQSSAMEIIQKNAARMSGTAPPPAEPVYTTPGIVPSTTATFAPIATPKYNVGDIKKGYEFKGGDATKPENWKKVQ